MRIRDGKNSDPGSGMGKIRVRDKHPGILDKHPGSPTLHFSSVRVPDEDP